MKLSGGRQQACGGMMGCGEGDGRRVCCSGFGSSGRRGCGVDCASGMSLWVGGCAGRGFVGSMRLVWMGGEGCLRVCGGDDHIAGVVWRWVWVGQGWGEWMMGVV